MIRSLFSGVSSVRNHQVRMDTLSNNIANVNTTGYKSGRTSFMDALSQNMRGYGSGRNPVQVGTGVSVAGIGTNMNQGPLQMTSRSLDLAINGNGFFRVDDGSDSGTILYSRDGNFFTDDQGYVRNSMGYYLLDDGGSHIQLNDPATPIETINISQDGSILVNGAAPASGNKIALATFPNPEGLFKVSTNLYKETTASGVPSDPGNSPTTGYGTIESGYLEMSNVDLSEEFSTMITTQRGYQAGARIITVSDTLLEELINLKR